ncbi:MAG: bifunctional phosphoglucose/phosphomannose isomerase [Candidatus Bathyarchaeia archaeon]|nr:bifunctional phosphoglucose/phosphomannose isomerase [Candidatus Bathyarchaeota archaeon]
MDSGILDDGELLRSVDGSDMLRLLEGAPGMLSSAFRAAADQGVEPPSLDLYESIVVAGVGGSAICGDLLSDWLSPRTGREILVSRSYRLPSHVKKGSLLIAISYSGNTFETLMQVEEAVKRGLTIYAVTSGGELEDRCVRRGIPLLRVEGGMPPRYALPAVFGSVAYLMCEGGLAGASEVEGAAERMRILNGRVGFKASMDVNPSKRLAARLVDRAVSIYALDRMGSVARRFKCQLNENSKMEARFDLIPELCHNEVEAWEGLKEMDGRAVVLVRDPFEDEVEKNIIGALRRLLHELGVTSLYEVDGEGSSPLEAIWTAIYLLDYTSYYLAILRGVDPEPVKGIARFKEILKAGES